MAIDTVSKLSLEMVLAYDHGKECGLLEAAQTIDDLRAEVKRLEQVVSVYSEELAKAKTKCWIHEESDE